MSNVVEQLGDVSYLHGLFPNGVEIVAQLTERLSSVPKTELRVDFDRAQVFALDGEGQRLR